MEFVSACNYCIFLAILITVNSCHVMMSAVIFFLVFLCWLTLCVNLGNGFWRLLFWVHYTSPVTVWDIICNTSTATASLRSPHCQLAPVGLRGSPGSWHEVKPPMSCCPACGQSVTASKHKKPDSILVPCSVVPADQVMFLKAERAISKVAAGLLWGVGAGVGSGTNLWQSSLLWSLARAGSCQQVLA